MPVFDLERITFWAFLKEVVRRDTILYFEPFKFTVGASKQERAKS